MKFKSQPRCEACGNEDATSFSYFDEDESWKFTGDCTRETEMYCIDMDNFFKSNSSTVDWLAHMHEKNWMNWPDFMAMMHRFRSQTDSFGQID